MTRGRSRRHLVSLAVVSLALVLISVVIYRWTGDSRNADSGDQATTQPLRAQLRFDLHESGMDQPVITGTTERLFIFESLGIGAALLDVDADGRLDVLVQNGGTARTNERQNGATVEIIPGPGPTLYRQLDTGRFADVTRDAGIPPCAWGTGVATADIDNDDDVDVLLTAFGPNLLLINDGNGRFHDASASSGLAHPGHATSAVFIDFDRDGWLDLYVANYVEFDLQNPPNRGAPCQETDVEVSCAPSMHASADDVLYRNRGDGTFEDVTERAGCSGTTGGYGLGVVAGDFDRDGWPDLYVANDTTANFLWRNRGDGTFEDVALIHGAALSETAQAQSGMGVTLGDADGDGALDVFVTNYALEPNAFYRNLGDGSFSEDSTLAGLGRSSHPYLGWGTSFLDIDHDGGLDLVVVNGHVHPRIDEVGNPKVTFRQRPLVFLNTGDATFRTVDSMDGPLLTPRNHRGLTTGDVDGDGALDLLVTVLDGPPLIYLNRSTGRGNWIGFRLRGTNSNRNGIGARVTITVGQTAQSREISSAGGYLCATEPRAHFGVGSATNVDTLKVLWPSGKTTEGISIDVNRRYLLDEDQGLIDE